ncbi:MAG: hypothetical protein R3A50_01500 [Saprospiraceae bacterium]
MNIKPIVLLLAICAAVSCKKDPFVQPPSNYQVFVDNEFSELKGRFAIFVSDQSTGELLAFRWIPGEDSIILQVPNSSPSDKFDCTILKVTTLTAPGSGVRDTTLTLTTYTDLPGDQQINLRDQVYQQGTNMTFNLTGFNTLDSVVVPDAYAILRPESFNNYEGEYYCYHSGKCWIRVLVDGDPFWRFVRFDNVNGSSLEANTLNTDIFVSILAPPLKLNFPFASDWEYKVDGVVDSLNLEFFPLSGQLVAPGSYIPIIDRVDVFEPVNNDLFDPNRPYSSLRVQTRGTEPDAGGYTYISDHFYGSIPAALPIPNFDVEETLLADKRLIAVNCVGDFDLLAFSRNRGNPDTHLHINWEVITKPNPGLLSYRLPDVPVELGSLYPPLKAYDFSGGVKARADAYDSSISYETILKNHLAKDDVLWQAKAGYLGKEKSF